MFFGAKPSEVQLNAAQRLGIELEYTPIGKDVPINNITIKFFAFEGYLRWYVYLSH